MAPRSRGRFELTPAGPELRVGHLALAYQTLDGSETGYWDKQKHQWQVDNDYRDSVAEAIAVANKQAAPDLLEVPVEAPGVKTSLTPNSRNFLASSSGMIPPPKTAMSPAPRSFKSRITSGNSVMCAPDRMLNPTASTSSCTAASAIISGV